jgi:hypothetical protein
LLSEHFDQKYKKAKVVEWMAPPQLQVQDLNVDAGGVISLEHRSGTDIALRIRTHGNHNKVVESRPVNEFRERQQTRFITADRQTFDE